MQYLNSHFRSSISMRKQLYNALYVTFNSFTLALCSKNGFRCQMVLDCSRKKLENIRKSLTIWNPLTPLAV